MKVTPLEGASLVLVGGCLIAGLTAPLVVQAAIVAVPVAIAAALFLLSRMRRRTRGAVRTDFDGAN